MNRLEELHANLERVEQRISEACNAAGRSRAEISLIAVTKTWPAVDIKLVAQLGLKDIGESKDQEAFAKFQECGDLGLTWHFIGQIQSNKIRHIAQYADVVHALDRPKVVDMFDAAARESGRQVTGLVQVSLDGSDVSARAGVDPKNALALADQIARCSNIRLGGVMGVAPLKGNAAEAFALLQGVSQQISARFESATIISAGMSEDLTEAIAHGATHLRIGSAIMGSRSYVQ